MKKIFFSGFFLLFFSLLAFFHPVITYAQLVATDCVCDTSNVSTDGSNKFTCTIDGTKRSAFCPSKLACANAERGTKLAYTYQGSQFGITGEKSTWFVESYGVSCQEPQKEYNCHCKAPNSPGSGNGVQCDGLPVSTPIFCPNNLACHDDSSSATFLDGLPNGIAKGIRCDQPYASNCICDNGGNVAASGKNGFRCNFGGETGNMHGYCANSSLACLQGSSANLYPDANWDGDTSRNEVAQGITCGTPVATNCVCDTNQRPKPQQNGFTCTYNGTRTHGWCDVSEHVCTQDANNVFLSTGANDQFTTSVKMTGIRCDNKVVNPAAPPCAVDPKTTGGKCTAIASSIGTIGTDPASFIDKLFGILLAASGAIGLILIMRAGYKIMTARGNPEGIKEGREQIVAAIIGLMFLIFSFVLLQIIGVDLLQLPGSAVGGGSIPIGGTCDVNNPKCSPGLVCKYNGSQGQCQNP